MDPFRTFHSPYFAEDNIFGVTVKAQLLGGEFAFVLSLGDSLSLGSYELGRDREPYIVHVLDLYRSIVTSDRFKKWKMDAMADAKIMLEAELERQIEQYHTIVDEWENMVVEVKERV